MPVCYVCQINFSKFRSLILHLKFKHKIMTSEIFKCREQGCFRDFIGVNSFRKHFFSKHIIHFSQTAENPQLPANTDVAFGVTGCPNSSVECETTKCESVLEQSDLETFKSNINLESVYFISQLYTKADMSRTQVQNIVSMVGNLFESIMSSFHNDALQFIDGQSEKSSELILSKLKLLKNPFSDLSTENLRFKYMTDNGFLIKPTEYVIGTRQESKLVAGNVVFSSVQSTAQFIPLRKTLKQLFSMPHIFEKTCNYIRDISDAPDVISNFVQAYLWHTKLEHFQDKCVLPLNLYFDDFETGNALGSHAGIHKLGAVYASIPCLPPEYCSLLENIILVLLFHSSDRSVLGNSAIFNILIDELIYLETEGISLLLPDRVVKVFFSVGIICGDNLGLHSILGFSESFTATYPCRFCKMSREVLQYSENIQPALLRTRSNYKEDVTVNDFCKTGIKEECVFNRIPSFHVTTNF